ncbi:Integral membrane sensor signal transduction histidine kinase [Nostocoides australiense Ben110]|uniref:histidine kinase n=1 Tax=Nostocoides australiense Ben110 TaxID=1193182 RepID=W6JSV5_9MICO|nr:histidine kinase [Tetrasphaera australiensis]CCH71752.1 Integral membrane sensor signal transduction histidine kinase [Tetrasphaera australiensis Ben110]
MIAVWRSIWREPRPADAPPAGRVDRLLAAAFAIAVLVEGLIRPGPGWQSLVTVLALAVVPALLWRRSRPLTACLIGFGVAGLLSVLQWATASADLGPSSMMAVLILLYSLVRWGSGREIALGLAFVVVVVALSLYVAAAGLGDITGGILLLMLIAALAAVFRYRADLWQRQEREIRNQERLALARELHDIVAHHVSAIAVQAQAGGVVAAAQPKQAAGILAAIESEASRTLAEMRDMVRVLREDTWAAAIPHTGIADLPALARTDATPTVEVSLAGSLTRLSRPVDAAIYRLAQEALTNAIRHASGATRVEIAVCRAGEGVRLRVADDGQAHSSPGAVSGFGLTGMAERAQLLGGTLSAGPGPDGGWVVEAVLPVRGPA